MMANKPVFGTAICPYCKAENQLFWNGNFRCGCFTCHKTFRVKRQKLKNVQPIKVNRRAEDGK